MTSTLTAKWREPSDGRTPPPEPRSTSREPLELSRTPTGIDAHRQVARTVTSLHAPRASTAACPLEPSQKPTGIDTHRQVARTGRRGGQRHAGGGQRTATTTDRVTEANRHRRAPPSGANRHPAVHRPRAKIDGRERPQKRHRSQLHRRAPPSGAYRRSPSGAGDRHAAGWRRAATTTRTNRHSRQNQHRQPPPNGANPPHRPPCENPPPAKPPHPGQPVVAAVRDPESPTQPQAAAAGHSRPASPAACECGEAACGLRASTAASMTPGGVPPRPGRSPKPGDAPACDAPR